MDRSADEPILEVRPVTPEDAEPIGRIRVRAWQAAYQAFMPADYLDALDQLRSLGDLRRMIVEGPRRFAALLARFAGEPAGFATLGEPRHPTEAGTCELWALNVDQHFWRRGVGSALVRAADHRAAAQGFGRMELWCIVGNVPG